MRRSTRPILLILLAILISGFIVYSPAVRAPFYLDDNSRIIDNPVIRSFSSIKWIWEYDPSRFIPHVTFAFNYLLDGINPAGYHVGNILIHILNTIIVLFLVRLLLSRGSFIGTLDRKYLNYLLFGVTLVFLLHPIQTSAVTYVVQRSTLLAATAYFSTILFYLLFKLKRSMGFYSASLICAAAGVFCKPLVITLPFVIILCELFCFDKSEENHKRRFLYVLPYFVIILLAFASYIVVSFKSFSFAHLTTISRETVVISRTSYLLTEFNVVVTYLRLLFFPLNQNLDYDYPIASSLFTSPTIFSFLVLVLLVGWGWSQRKRQPLISFGVFWFFLTLSSESSIFPISDVIFEHRLYIPMFGFALFLPVAIVLLFKNKHIASGVLAIVILIFSVLSYHRNDLWSHQTEFLIDVRNKSPNKARTNLNLGAHYLNIGNFPAATIFINKALIIEPDCAQAFYSKAMLNDKLGQPDESVQNYTRAIELNPQFVDAYVNRGYIYLVDNNYSLALKDFNEALRINPHDENANNDMGVINFRQGNYNAAMDYFKKVVKINPRNTDVLNNIKALEMLLKSDK